MKNSTLIQLIVIIAIITVGTWMYFTFVSQANVEFGATGRANSTLTEGLVGHWTFDGPDVDWSDTGAEIRDISGNSNHGDASTSGMSTANATSGVLGQGMAFDGVDSRVRVPSSGDIPSVLNPLGNDFSASVWFRISENTSTPGDWDYILSCGFPQSSASRHGYYIRYGNQLSVISFNGVNENNIGFSIQSDGVSVRQWQLATVVREDNSFLLYLDGQLVGSDTATGIIDCTVNNITGARAFAIGNLPYASSTVSPIGSLDDVRIYNRALSAEEVQELYELGADKLQVNTNTSQKDWYDPSWPYREKITIDSDHIDSELQDFPVYIDLSTLSSGFWNTVQNGGGDIRITTKDGTTEVPREIVSADTTTDTGELHFKSPFLSDTQDSTFYIYYGNSTASDYATSATYGAENVWDDDFVLVSHDGGGTDSTSNNNDGTGYGGVSIGTATGQVGGATEFDGGGDYIDTVDDPLDITGNEMNIGFWMKVDTDDAQGITSNENTGTSFGYRVFLWTGRDIIFDIGNGSGYGRVRCDECFALDEWIYVTALYDGLDLTLYTNGSELLTGDSWTDNITATDYATRIGGIANYSGRNLDGNLDEFRISSTARTADWISAEYENQNSPNTFYVPGGEETYLTGIDTGLVGHWTFDGPDVDWSATGTEIRDISGNGNHGDASTSGMSTANATGGVLGQGMAFDGVGDKVNVGNSIQFDEGDNFSFSIWFKTTSSAPQANANRAVSQWNQQYGIGLSFATKHNLCFSFRTETFTATTWNCKGSDLNDNIWHHAVGSINRQTGMIETFIDGVSIGATDYSTELVGTFNGGRSFGIGYGEDSSGFNGSLDDVRIYNRALSAEEVQELYELGADKLVVNKTPPRAEDGLVGHWTFDGPDVDWSDTGTEIRDISGNGNHGDASTSGMSTANATSGVLGQGLAFNGSSDEVAIGDTSIDTKTLILWIKPDSLTESILELDSTTTIELNSGSLQTAGFTDPTHFINGSKADHINTLDWIFLALTTDTAIDTTDLTLGSVGGTDFFSGSMDSVRLYDRVLTHEEIFRLYTQEAKHLQTCGSIKDSEENLYGTIRIGEQCWMQENLNIGTRIDGANNQTDNSTIEKYCHSDDPANCDIYGGLYQWDEMMQYETQEGTQGICPVGWHIPSDDEWKTLEMHLGMSQAQADGTSWRGTDEGDKLKTAGDCFGGVNCGVSNFEGLLAGYRNASGSFHNLGSLANLWSSSESGSNAWRRSLGSGNSTVYRTTHSQAYGFSVRCVKD